MGSIHDVRNYYEKMRGIVEKAGQDGIDRSKLAKMIKKSSGQVYSSYMSGVRRGECAIEYNKYTSKFFMNKGKDLKTKVAISGKTNSYLPEEFLGRFKELVDVCSGADKEAGLNLIAKGAQSIRMLDAILSNARMNINLKKEMESFSK